MKNQKYRELIDKYIVTQSENSDYDPPSYRWVDNTGEIVRCEDCCYAPIGDKDGADLEWPESWVNPCPFKCSDCYYSKKPDPNFFCANGKRKERK